MVTIVNVSSHEKECLNVGLLQIAADILVTYTSNSLRHRTSVTILNTLVKKMYLVSFDFKVDKLNFF